MPAEGGSFFNLFEDAEDPFDVRVFHVRHQIQILDAKRWLLQLGVLIANDVFPEAVEYFLGQAGGDGIDSDDEEDDEDEDDEEEIDLEKPRPKKQKKA